VKPSGNGKNRFWIEVKCQYQVHDDEWAVMLLLINLFLKEHNHGEFSNVGAFLCEDDDA
jgi:hypothetical protein